MANVLILLYAFWCQIHVLHGYGTDGMLVTDGMLLTDDMLVMDDMLVTDNMLVKDDILEMDDIWMTWMTCW